MNEDWVKVYSSPFPHEMNIAKAILEENQIPYTEVNKKDSFYVTVGEIELYVNKTNALRALHLITPKYCE